MIQLYGILIFCEFLNRTVKKDTFRCREDSNPAPLFSPFQLLKSPKLITRGSEKQCLTTKGKNV